MDDKELDEFLRMEWEDALLKAQDRHFQVALDVIAELDSALRERRQIRENFRDGLRMMLLIKATLEARNAIDFASDSSKLKPRR